MPVLVRTVGDANQLDAVKVEALVGIIRHAKLRGIQTPQDRSTVSNAMLAVATSKPAAGTAGAGQAWMRAQAAEVLRLLGEASGPVTTALASMVSDPTLPFSTRCAAADALGRLNYRGGAGLNPSALAAALGRLAADACAAEERAAKISRRRLKSRLRTASVGLTGPDGNSGVARLATGPPHAAFVAALKTALTAMLGHVDGPGTADDKTMLENVKQEVPKLTAAPTNTPGP